MIPAIDIPDGGLFRWQNTVYKKIRDEIHPENYPDATIVVEIAITDGIQDWILIMGSNEIRFNPYTRVKRVMVSFSAVS